jgi:RNA polymerase sigma-70 factor, ECF subfamily
LEELAALYGDLAPRLYSYIRRLTGDESVAQDILQETFLRATEHYLIANTTLKPAWFYTVARNYYLDLIRRHSKHSSGVMVENTDAAASDSPEAAWETKEQKRVVQDVLNALPENYRTVLVLREFEELSYRDIGAVMGLTMAQVKVTLYRARQRFRELYSEEEES